MKVIACMVLLLLAALAEGQPHGPKPKKVKCQDKRYPQCYHIKQLCPPACPRTCYVDCASCQPVCGPPLPSTPPYPSTPPPSPPTSNPPPSPPAASTPPPSPPTLTPPSASTPPASPPASNPPPQSPPAPTPRVSPPTYTPPPTSTPPPAVPTPPSSNSTQTPPANPPPEVSGRRVFCKNRNYPQCYRMEQRCPSNCPDQCEVDCVTCSPVCNCNRPGAVCQDPRFVGADGIAFYFHGKKDKDFCVVSDSNLHINAHFIGRRNENMKRDFTWVQSLGILFDNNQLFIGAKKTSTWNDEVDRLDLAFNGQPIYLSEGEGAKWEPFSGVSITRSRDTNSVVIQVEGNFQIKATVVPITQKESRIHKYGITEEDCFAHLDLNFNFYSLSGDVNGVLGQTYGRNYVSRVKMGVKMPVLGGDKEFSSSSLFSTDCQVSKFSGTAAIINSSMKNEYANLKCVSGLNGRGVVCKR